MPRDPNRLARIAEKIRKVQEAQAKQQEQGDVNSAIQAVAERRATHGDSVLLMQKGKIPLPKPEKPKTQADFLSEYLKLVGYKADAGISMSPKDSATAKRIGKIEEMSPAQNYTKAMHERQMKKWEEEDKAKPRKMYAESLSTEASIKRSMESLQGKPEVGGGTKGTDEYANQLLKERKKIEEYLNNFEISIGDASLDEIRTAVKEKAAERNRLYLLDDPIIKTSLKNIEAYMDSMRMAEKFQLPEFKEAGVKNIQGGLQVKKYYENVSDQYKQLIKNFGFSKDQAESWLMENYSEIGTFEDLQELLNDFK